MSLDRKTAIGDGNQVEIFDAVDGTHKITLDRNTTVSFEGDVDVNNLTITFTSAVNNSDWKAFKKEFLRDLDVVDVEDTFTNGEKFSEKGDFPGVPKLFCTWLGGKEPDGKHGLLGLHGVLQVGSVTVNPNETVKVEASIVGSGVSSLYTFTAAIPNLYYSEKIVLDTDLTIAAGKIGVEKYYDAV